MFGESPVLSKPTVLILRVISYSGGGGWGLGSQLFVISEGGEPVVRVTVVNKTGEDRKFTVNIGGWLHQFGVSWMAGQWSYEFVIGYE